MRSCDFEIGKLYRDLSVGSLISVRVNETHGIRLRPYEHGQPIELKYFTLKYRECEFYELTAKEQDIFQKYIQPLIKTQTVKVVETCTCQINILMSTGCKCGWISKERGKT